MRGNSGVPNSPRSENAETRPIGSLARRAVASESSLGGCVRIAWSLAKALLAQPRILAACIDNTIATAATPATTPFDLFKSKACH